MSTESERLMMLERNLSDQGKSITVIVEDQREIRGEVSDLKQAEAVRVVEYKHLTERLDAVYGLGKWLLGAVGGVLVVALLGLILKGGPLG